MKTSPALSALGVTIAENTLSPLYGNPLARALDQLPQAQKVSPTRAQFAQALRAAFGSKAFVHVGGRHVALHVNGEKTPRDVMFTGSTPDWR